MKELIAHAKNNPGKLNYATSGNGSAPHLAAVLFMRLAGVEMVHVPYKGGAPAVQSVLAGDTQLAFATPPSVLPLVQAGRLRALAITSRNAHAAGARRAGHGRGRPARLRDLVLVRLLRPGGHAGRGGAQAVRRDREALKLPEVAKHAWRAKAPRPRARLRPRIRRVPRRGREALGAPGKESGAKAD